MSESITASHILVNSVEEAVGLQNQLFEGQDFADLAQAHSLCPSKANGGNLGPFGRGMMVPSFEEAAFGLDVGQVSDPVQTQFGWHLIHRTG